MEHVCNDTRPAADRAIYQACLNGQLKALRDEFGVDLKGLAPKERKALDSGCTPLRTDREAYVRCLSDQLIALRNRRNHSKPLAADESSPTGAGSHGDKSGTASGPPAVTRVSQQSSASRGLWFGAIVATLIVAGGGFMLVRKPRARETPACRVCGGVPESGNMCQTCRHEAAEARRRAAAERVEEQRARERADEEEERRQAELAEQDHQHQAQLEEATHLHQEEQARRHRLARQEEERREREDEARAQPQAADAPDGEFDPHDVLGLPEGASLEQITAAHKVAKAKFELAVDFGGTELKAYFEAKRKAVDRAFLMLTK